MILLRASYLTVGHRIYVFVDMIIHLILKHDFVQRITLLATALSSPRGPRY
jgi:hypothetical protein